MFTRSILHSTKQLPKFSKPLPAHTRFFHPTLATMVQVGDSVPDVELQEGSPGNKVHLAKEVASGKSVIVGIPAAFSPNCSDDHIPGFIRHPDIKKHKVFVVSVNDAFVMNAWAKKLDENGESGIRFLADPTGSLTKAWDLVLDSPQVLPIFGAPRGQRFAAQIEDGKVKNIGVDADPTTVVDSTAEKVL